MTGRPGPSSEVGSSSRELVAALFEEILAKKSVLKYAEDYHLDVVPAGSWVGSSAIGACGALQSRSENRENRCSLNQDHGCGPRQPRWLFVLLSRTTANRGGLKSPNRQDRARDAIGRRFFMGNALDSPRVRVRIEKRGRSCVDRDHEKGHRSFSWLEAMTSRPSDGSSR